jgi:DNA-binding Xre family transcriptional regulator
MLDTEKIKVILKQKGFTIVSLSNAIDMSNQNMHNIFKTKKTGCDTLEKIAQALNTPICEFFDTPQHTGNIASTADGHKIELLEKEVKHLKRELEMKDKIIKLLEGKG